MSTNTIRPASREVGRRAAEILSSIEADPEYGRLVTSTKYYADCWATFTGYPVIARWDLESDKHALAVEALRALALKAAVYDLTHDEVAAELLIALPVDEMVHAVLAQHNIVSGLQARLGVLLPHMTDLEEFGWEPGDYTSDCYAAAGWGEMNPRYWVGSAEAKRRLALLDAEYRKAGVRDNGRSHMHDFALAAA